MLYLNHQMLSGQKNCAQPHPPAGLPGRCEGKMPAVNDPQLAKWQTQLARTQTALAQLGLMRPVPSASNTRTQSRKAAPTGSSATPTTCGAAPATSAQQNYPGSSRCSPTSNASGRSLIAASISPSRSPTVKPPCSALPHQIHPDGHSRTPHSQVMKLARSLSTFLSASAALSSASPYRTFGRPPTPITVGVKPATRQSELGRHTGSHYRPRHQRMPRGSRIEYLSPTSQFS